MSARSTLLWSVRRELWENRYVYFIPMFVAGIALLGYLGSLGYAAANGRMPASLDAARPLGTLLAPYAMAAGAVLLWSFVAGLFYCADALYSERRDRSILFWKSMPVSDCTTVLAKACVPAVVMPLAASAIVIATQALMLLAATAMMLSGGVDAGAVWTRIPAFAMTLSMLYGVGVHVLWYAPVYAWLLLVSGWAPRAPLLWAVVPPFAIYVAERLTLGTSWFLSALQYRAMGAMQEAFVPEASGKIVTKLSQLDPQRFFLGPNLWLGLAFAALCVAGAIRLRRYREPN